MYLQNILIMKRGRNDEKINHILNKCGCIFIGFILIFSLFSIPVRANEGKIRVGGRKILIILQGKKGSVVVMDMNMNKLLQERV